MVKITLKPKHLALYVIGLIACLTTVHLAAQSAVYFFGFDSDSTLIKVFNLEKERSIPTLFVTIQWLICVLLLVLITLCNRARHEPYLYWLGLAAIFMFLAADEALVLHERLIKVVTSFRKTTGVLYFAWIIPYGLAFGLLGLVYMRFLFKLPAKIRNLFCISAAIFIGGAIGFEMLQGRYFEMHGKDAFFFLVLVSVEETLEMLGLAIFMYALMKYMEIDVGPFQIQFRI